MEQFFLLEEINAVHDEDWTLYIRHSVWWEMKVEAGVYILQMTHILFPGRADHSSKIFAIEGNPTPSN